MYAIRSYYGVNQRALGDMQVNHGGSDVGMSEQVLKRDNINTLFEQVGSI